MAGTLTAREPRALRPTVWRDPFAMLREEMGDLVTNFFGETGDSGPMGRMLPSLDLSETDSAVEVRVDVPGIKAEDIDVQLTGNVLTVSGQRKEEKEEKGKTFHRVERRSGSFSRTVTLPSAVQDDKVDAQYRDGVLTISMHKTEEAKARKIKVKT